MSSNTSRTQRPSVGTLAGLIAVVLISAGCGSEQSGEPVPPPTASGNDGLVVYVVNYPLMYFAERIGGDRVEVVFPAPADEDPAFWRPDVDTMAAYQAADLVVRNGAGYAKWIAMASLPDSTQVYTSAAFFEDVIVEESAVTHSHGPEGEHSHGETAFTTWLDLQQAKMQAEAIADALARVDPDGAATFTRNAEALYEDLEALDARLLEAAEGLQGEPILASHPVYQYLARRYGLDVHSVFWEPGEAPDAGAWAELESLHAEQPATVMLWEQEPLESTTARLEQMGIRVVVFDPVGNRPAGVDFLDVMDANVNNLTSQ